VVVTGDGYVLTNNHVIDSADDIRVEFTDGRSFKAKLVGADKPSDLALLKIESTNLPTVALGNSDGVQVGDVVLAVGNPLGIGQTVTMGIISAKGRSTGNGDGSYEDFLQTDAPINHGNSGGALVNLKGELVGINSQIVSQSDGNIGIGFAIPANMARHVMDDLRKDGRVRRSQLGVSIQPMTSDLADSLGLKDVSGVIVSSVSPDSAADRAGLKRGDVIKSFNGQPVHDYNALRNRVADMAPGSSATVTVVRDGSEKTLNVKLDEAAASKSARERDTADGNDDQAALGVAVAPLTPELAAQAKLPRNAKGVVVQDVNPNGRAADAGIAAGDIILEVNRQPVQSVDELRAAVRKTTDRPTLLLVSREGRELFVTVRPS
jgi:Do/DeqQ family serine protease